MQKELELLKKNPYNRLKMLKAELIIARFSVYFMSKKRYKEYLTNISNIINSYVNEAGYRDDFFDYFKIYYKEESDYDGKKIEKLFNMFWIYKWFKFKNIDLSSLNNYKPKKYYNYLLEKVCLFEECVNFEEEKIIYKILKND